MTYPNTASVSNFRPTAAKAIYGRFVDHEASVLDFSAGFGGRLLGALASGRSYVGIEPDQRNITGMRKTVDILRALDLLDHRPRLLRGCAEDVMPQLPSASFSLVFSSPPYFSRERYTDHATQSYVRFETFEAWTNGFLRIAIRESARVLKARGRLLLNVSDVFGFPIVKESLQLAAPFFRLEHVCFLRLGRLPYIRNASRSPFKREPLLVLQKR
jgi:tRNA1(Val) A37 N6-methylase TrmN6